MNESGSAYTPRAGSKAEAAIAALAGNGWMSRADLAEAAGCDITCIDSNLASAAKYGAVRKVARDGVAGYVLGGAVGDPLPDDGETEVPVKKPRRKPLRKAAPAPRARQPKPQRLREQVADDEPAGDTRIGVLDDGTVIVFDGAAVTARIGPEVAKKIATMIERLAAR